MTTTTPFTANPHPGMGFRQFVALIAALMAVNALPIDPMLPALPAIGATLHIPTDNGRQWIVTAYLLGFGAAQIFYGTLSDRFGRKTVLLAGLSAFVVFSIVSALANTFEVMIFARVMQGVGSAASRVLAVSIVRDCYSGRQMARVMSFTFIVFLAVPILAPSLGQLVMLVAPWRWIFVALAGFGLITIAWAALKLPETLHPEDRIPISAKGVTEAFRDALTNRIAVGYMLAMTITLGGLFGFINTAQQAFADVFHEARLFTAFFALIAFSMAVSSLLNARIVDRLGTRRVSHTALVAYIVFALLHAAAALLGLETVWVFAVLMAGLLFCFGLVASNFGSMSMEPLGHLAGTASSVQGFVTTLGGAVIGFYIGQSFNGTVIPLTVGIALCGIAGFVVVAVTEKGRLFQPSQHSDEQVVLHEHFG